MALGRQHDQRERDAHDAQGDEAGTPVEASREIANALPPDLCRFEILPGAGHFPWLDDPDRYFALVDDFVDAVATGRP